MTPSALLLLLTFPPLLLATMLINGAFVRAGYGAVGRTLAGGFVVLTLSIVLGLANQLHGSTDTLIVAAGVTRVSGWVLVCCGCWFLYDQAAR